MTNANIRIYPGAATPAVEGGLTHEQAMEVHHRFCARLQALPTVAHEMGIDFAAACAALDGKDHHRANAQATRRARAGTLEMFA